MLAADLDVLIVDDHEAMRDLLVRVLESAGVRKPRTAGNGAEALAQLRQRPAQLILADQRMPGMSGTEFIAAVRGDASLGAPRIIMISGATDAAHVDQARAAGADAVLVKPVTPRALLAAIAEVLA